MIREPPLAALEDFPICPQGDDTAIVVMRFTGAPAEPGRQALAGTARARV